MAPEYAFNGLFSIKSDVFSFGILVLEMVSGKRSRGFLPENHGLALTAHVSIISHFDQYIIVISRTSHIVFENFRHGH